MRIHHRRQTVCNHQGGLVLRSALQLRLNRSLIRAVERRGGLVKNHNRRVFQQGACNRHALFFAARQLQATLAHHGVVALGCGRDEIVNVRSACRLLHLGFGRVGSTIGNVVAHGVVEQHGILRHDAHGTAHAALGHLANVLSIDGDRATAHVVEAKQQTCQGGFARPRRPHHRHGFARWNFKADAMQDGSCGFIGKHHRFKLHRRWPAQLKDRCIVRISHFTFFFKQGEHAV